jgi:flagellar basal-body rod modification protein FlgD
MASAISAITSSSAAAAAAGAASVTTAAPSQEMLLKLLVAQIKNQDPTNPTDSTQFVSQLAQFSELEQVIAIRGDLDTQLAQTTASQQTPTSTQV